MAQPLSVTLREHLGGFPVNYKCIAAAFAYVILSPAAVKVYEHEDALNACWARKARWGNI